MNQPTGVSCYNHINAASATIAAAAYSEVFSASTQKAVRGYLFSNSSTGTILVAFGASGAEALYAVIPPASFNVYIPRPNVNTRMAIKALTTDITSGIFTVNGLL